MPNYRRARIEGGCYFFTVVTYRRQPIFCYEKARSGLREGIQRVMAVQPFDINAWVLLPDHLHCIWTLPKGDADCSMRWSMIKRYVTQKCASEFQHDEWKTESKIRRKESTIWQRRFWEHMIRDDKDYEIHMNYIHYNPVKHGLVESVKEWEYSTFHRYVRDGIYPETWGNHVDIPTDMSFGE